VVEGVIKRLQEFLFLLETVYSELQPIKPFIHGAVAFQHPYGNGLQDIVYCHLGKQISRLIFSAMCAGFEPQTDAGRMQLSAAISSLTCPAILLARFSPLPRLANPMVLPSVA
jgi:hypothetical protein